MAIDEAREEDDALLFDHYNDSRILRLLQRYAKSYLIVQQYLLLCKY